jgi:hypothetical protein
MNRSEIRAASGDLSTLPSEHAFLGFRPEAIEFNRTDCGGLKIIAKIEWVEILGPESLVLLNFAGAKDTIVAKVDMDPSFPITGPIAFNVKLSDLHSFER